MLVPVGLFFWLLSLTPAATEVGLGGKVLLFPTETDTSYVKLIPEKPLSLSAFTLCMRVATELPGQREIILFAYRVPKTHLCITWESETGLTAFWVDGRRSLFQFYRRGHLIHPGGIVLLGQDADRFVGGFDASQSFVGEITDVHMWDHVLSSSQVKAVYSNQEPYVPKGNVFDWDTIKYDITGNVLVIQD
ncbi:pentraxin fusion protein-like isoform X2 [Carassius auratus]|uniref:Pentraxin fusion protein-like isoform X2 n=1 Tax=Carassius auratus TaxID=7957 RepID=A0A6P6NZY9_CARAU|nr:pentraxin fusion protein-like isoform X2 [Carassius auratus]